MQRLQRLSGQEAYPEEWWHRWLGDVFPGPTGDFEIRVLEHVRRIEAPLQAPIEAQPDHPPQSLAVPGEQLGHGLLVAAIEAVKQVTIL
jgi:hypothetical protein